MHLGNQWNSLPLWSNELWMISVLYAVVNIPILYVVGAKQVLPFEIVEQILSIGFVVLSTVRPTSLQHSIQNNFTNSFLIKISGP